MKRAIILLTIMMALISCSQERENVLTACEVQADRFYQRYQSASSDDPRSQYIIGCMATKHYRFDISSPSCVSHRPFASQFACYAPVDWFAWIIDHT